MGNSFYAIDSEEASWSSGKEFADGNVGHRPGVKGGYFPVPPVDSLYDIRCAMVLAMEEMGVDVEVHHLEDILETLSEWAGMSGWVRAERAERVGAG